MLEQLTITKRRNTLREMPKGLRDAFGDTIERIQRQRGAAELAMGVLKWTYLTRRPLRLEELRHALAVNPTDTRLDRDNFVSEKSLLSCCLGLIVIHEGTSTVRLVHLLLQEYLISQHQRLFKTGHSEIAQTCLTYMNFDNFSAEHTEIEKWLGYFTFFRYAACNWGHHVREQEDQPVEELALCLLQQPTTLKNISQVLGRSMRSYAEIHSVLFSALHVVAYFGASNVVRLLIDQARTESKDTQLQTLNSQDPRGRTPLLWAAAYGHEAVVRQFLELDDIDVNSKDHDEETPLSLAVKNKKDAVVRLLLERTDVDVNIRDHSGDTPLWCAFKTGHEAVVRILLERDDVDVNAKYRDHHTPLLLAAKNRKDAVVRLLLKRADVDVNIRDRSGETPLLHAAERGYEAIVRILLERADIDVNSKYQGSDTPLCCASKNCHETVVELLLERDDVDVNEKDWQGWTPLSHAIENGNETIVRLILQRADVDVHTTIPWGHPPLLHASGLSRQLIAQPPCRDEIEVSVRGQTPLSHAAEKGNKAVIMLLQQRNDINVNVQDEDGNTPLLCAARDGKDEVVQLLLARDDIDVSIKGWMGKTAISYAAENGNEGVVRLLLERDDIDGDDKDSARKTLESYTAMIHLLLELEIVEANAKTDCISPLWRTTESSNAAALQQMMERALMATYHYPTNPELET